MSVPRFYTAEDLGGLDKDQLAIVADARGLDVEGTGADGNVLVEDLVQAITDHQDASGINPALEPVPELPVEREYVVRGPQAVFGHKTGEKFRATVPSVQEKQLIEGGHIRTVRGGPVSSVPSAGRNTTKKEG